MSFPKKSRKCPMTIMRASVAITFVSTSAEKQTRNSCGNRTVEVGQEVNPDDGFFIRSLQGRSRHILRDLPVIWVIIEPILGMAKRVRIRRVGNEVDVES